MAFQFLLGRLETTCCPPPAQASAGFQFLLGRLETFLGHPPFSTDQLFQFLLGRLETRPLLCNRLGHLRFNSS